jgi:3-dehydroquinate dehydratase-2
VVEVHISNLYRRDDWRSKSILAGTVTGVITGLGIDGYRLAMEHLVQLIAKP